MCNLDAVANFSNDGDAFRANVDTCKDIGNNDFLCHVDATNLDTDPSEGVDLLNELNNPILSEGVDTGEDTKKAVPKRVANTNPTLRYYWLILVCKFSGKTEEKCRKRNTKSFRQSCPFEIKINLSEDGQHLEVKGFNEQHSNHSISKELYDHLPRQQRLNENEYIVVKNALSLKANKKLIQHNSKGNREKDHP